MSYPTGQTLVRVLHGAFFLILSFCYTSHADSWVSPRPFESSSENGKFVARIVPATQSKKATLTVSSVGSGRTNKLWKTDLSNGVAPTRVMLADDGSTAITFDNWGGIGYGDDIVAVYSKSGQLSKYSLEQIAPPRKSRKEDSDFWATRMHYEGKFPHSTSSRHWRERSIEFLFMDGRQQIYCIWLNWDNRWVVWNMSDGRMSTPKVALSKQLDVQGRTRSKKLVGDGTFDPGALSFLGHLHFDEDKPMVEKWLHDPRFSSGRLESFSSASTEAVFSFTARSDRRKTADGILSRWGKEEAEDSKSRYSDSYQFLGVLKGVVSFSQAPERGQGVLRAYLIPETIPLDQWVSARPEHYLIADLTDSYPSVFKDGRLSDGKLSRDVNVIIYGVTPGKYRLKAIWDKAKPVTPGEEVLCKPGAGDFESVSSPVIVISKGMETQPIKIECTTPVAK